MAQRMSTASRMDRQRDNAATSRAVNSALKRKERANRDKKMKELIGKSQWPFTPSIMSWVSTKLGKPSSQVTEQEARNLASDK